MTDTVNKQVPTIQLGTGDVAIMPASTREDRAENAIAFVKRNAEHPIAVDVECDVTDEEIAAGQLAFLSFSNPKSIDAVVTMLQRLKATMTGEPAPSTPVQGYRATLEAILVECFLDQTPKITRIQKLALEALSQTDIQPNGAKKARELWDIACEEENEGYKNGMLAVLRNLGITITGINSTEDQPGPSISSTRLMLDGQLCGVCNEGVPLDHAQIGRLEADGTRTPYHMGCEGEAKTIEPCKDCGHHRKFCSECAEPSTEEEETE